MEERSKLWKKLAVAMQLILVAAQIVPSYNSLLGGTTMVVPRFVGKLVSMVIPGQKALPMV